MSANWQSRSLLAGVLVGGSASRMGQPKSLLTWKGRTFLEVVVRAVEPVVDGVVLLGEGVLPPICQGYPRLADAPGVYGPLAGMLAASRAAPDCAWLFSPCDLPLITESAVRWLWSQRSPGCWAILPEVRHGRVEPLFAVYEPEIAPRLEEVAAQGLGPSAIAGESRVCHPRAPATQRSAWTNVNTPGDLERLG
jgi:molybdopterin-guanine dinucleotide biosynthesis protein A